MKSFQAVNTIYSELRREIVERLIPPGTNLSENLLSKRWNVSRTPIREVLRRLESDGLVTSYPYKGFAVGTISIEDIDQLYAVKIYLEGLAGKLAAPIIYTDMKKLKVLEKLCKEMEGLFKKGDVKTYVRKNNEFHFYMWDNCGNKWLIKMLENLDSHVSRFIVKALHVPKRMGKSVKEHWDIYEKLKMGNEKGVEKAIGKHFKNASDDLKMELIYK